VTARFDTADIRRYYDRHSATFVRYGQGGGAIHRAVWGPGTTTRNEAFHYVDDRIRELIAPRLSASDDTHVVDLGCGVGGSLCYLARQLPIRGTGITLSPAQVALSRRVIAAAGVTERVVCLEGDYCDLPFTLAPADVAYAIEAFVHGSSPERFFAQCHRLIKPGGLLAICDDLRRDGTSPEAVRTVEEFKSGWHINTLLERDALVSLARMHGFRHESTIDLTPYIEINRPRDRVIAAYVAVLKRLPIGRDRFDYVIGGDALQTCLAKGWIGYELNVFRASELPPPQTTPVR
jgi:cyclopropane fatty-acyl-phospholipid synthase-like methyltransferase